MGRRKVLSRLTTRNPYRCAGLREVIQGKGAVLEETSRLGVDRRNRRLGPDGPAPAEGAARRDRLASPGFYRG